MHIAYKDYYWKNGKPYGKDPIDPASESSFRVVVDPYYKRFSLEHYTKGKFNKLLYDSALFDFRALRKPELAIWHREAIDEENSLIRNEEDRVILVESYLFDGDFCRSCLIVTPYAIPVAYQRMYYEHLGDGFNGVRLFDAENMLVMEKIYKMHENGHEFGELISESWDTSAAAKQDT